MADKNRKPELGFEPRTISSTLHSPPGGAQNRREPLWPLSYTGSNLDTIGNFDNHNGQSSLGIFSVLSSLCHQPYKPPPCHAL